MKPTIAIIAVLVLLSANRCIVTAQTDSKPFIIDPTIQNFDSFPAVSSNLSFFVGTVQDTTRFDEGIVGQTRISRKVFAPIKSEPSPAVAVKRSLEQLLAKKDIGTSDISNASWIIQVVILDFSLEETSKFLSQTMDGKVKIEVTLIDPLDAGKKRTFTVESQHSRSAMDTSKFAEETMRNALEGALKEVLGSILKDA